MARLHSGVALLVLGASLAACGDEPAPDDEREACAPEPFDNATNVDLAVASPLPPALTPPTCAGATAELGAFLLLPPADSCLLSVTNGAAAGCCPGVAAQRSFDAILVYEIAASRLRLLEQLARVDLTAPDDLTVALSFEGQPVSPFQPNLDDFCGP
jgi:hypothetical protein